MAEQLPLQEIVSFEAVDSPIDSERTYQHWTEEIVLENTSKVCLVFALFASEVLENLAPEFDLDL